MTAVEKKYDYVEGLARIAQEMPKPANLDIDYAREGDNCEYCGAFIKNVYYFFSIEEAKAGKSDHQIMVGSECAHILAKYLHFDENQLDQAIKYFEKYKELAKEAEVSIEGRVALKDLEQKIREMRERAYQQKHLKFITETAPQREILNKVLPYWQSGIFSEWEVNFIESVKNQLAYRVLSARQLEILENMSKRVTNPEQALAQVEAIETQINADFKNLRLLNALKLSYFDRPFANSLWDWVVGNKAFPFSGGKLSGKPLTENQRAAVDKMLNKYARQIEEYKREYPNWENF